MERLLDWPSSSGSDGDCNLVGTFYVCSRVELTT